MRESPFKGMPDYEHACLSKLEQPGHINDQVMNWLKQTPKMFLVMLSNAGCGKTYICSALCNRFIEKKIDYYYLNTHDFYSKLREIIDKGWEPLGEIKKLCEHTVLFLDDICSTRMTEWQIENLFALIDLRWSYQKPTILTSNLLIKDMHEIFHDRLISRIKDKRNVLIEWNGEDKRK